MSKRCYYEVLQVDRSASGDEIKKAYRRLAIKFHPDQNPGNAQAEAQFKEANEAYQVLGDEKRRSQYDQFGHSAFNGGQGGGFETGGFSDIFDNIFGDIFGGGQSRGPAAGIDLRYNLEIEFEEAVMGAEKKIDFEKESQCDSCSGSGAKAGSGMKKCGGCQGTGQTRLNQGFFTLTRTCSQCMGRGQIIVEKCGKCRGAGKVRKKHSLEVSVPAGIDSGQRLRLRGEGEVGGPGGMPGDLYVVIEVKEHPLFKRQAEHIILELPISFVQASLGGPIEVPTLLGHKTLKLTPGTQSGDILRLRSKGIRRINGAGYGDQIISIKVETPTNLTPKQKQLLQEFEKEGTESSQPLISKFMEKIKDMIQT